MSRAHESKFKLFVGRGRLRTLFPRNSVSIPPKEGSQEPILVVRRPISEGYLNFLEGEAQTSSRDTAVIWST